MPEPVDPKPNCPSCKSSKGVVFVMTIKFWVCTSPACQNRLIGYEGGSLAIPTRREEPSTFAF